MELDWYQLQQFYKILEQECGSFLVHYWHQIDLKLVLFVHRKLYVFERVDVRMSQLSLVPHYDIPTSMDTEEEDFEP